MNVYEKIGLQRIINASGRMTALGVSTLSEEVASAAIEGGQSYVVITELMKKAGEIISTYTGGEASCVTSSASAGVCMSVAGIITKDNINLIRKMPDSSGLKNEIIIQKGHAIGFGAPITTMIRVGGGIPIEAGLANSVSAENVIGEINDKTAALLYVKSHHCVQKGMLPLEEMIQIAHEYQLPIIVDAAAEEDLKKYIELGADLVIYSGAKAIEATTSGFVTGKKIYMDSIQRQYEGIGRPMKIGKEGIMGLLKALELYEKKDSAKEVAVCLEKIHYINDELNKIEGVSAKISQDEAGREIYRSEITLDEKITKMSIVELDKQLKAGNPSIHCRSHFLSVGYMYLDPRPLVKDDHEVIVKRFKEILQGVN